MSVTVALARPTLIVGATTQAMATNLDAAGNVLGGRVIVYHSIEELAEHTIAAAGTSPSLIQYKDAEPLTTHSKRVDNSKAVRDLDHISSVTLEDGIGRTVKWMRRIYLGDHVREAFGDRRLADARHRPRRRARAGRPARTIHP